MGTYEPAGTRTDMVVGIDIGATKTHVALGRDFTIVAEGCRAHIKFARLVVKTPQSS